MDEEDDAAVEEDEDAAEEDDEAATEDEDEAATEDEDAMAEDDEDAVTAEEDDTDEVEDMVPATGSIGGMSPESSMLLLTVLAGSALGAGLLLRRRTLQA
jgi:hypothetical protein